MSKLDKALRKFAEQHTNKEIPENATIDLSLDSYQRTGGCPTCNHGEEIVEEYDLRVDGTIIASFEKSFPELLQELFDLTD